MFCAFRFPAHLLLNQKNVQHKNFACQTGIIGEQDTEKIETFCQSFRTNLLLRNQTVK